MSFFLRKYLLTLLSLFRSERSVSGFQFLNQKRVCTHACTCRHFLYSQLDRLTSTPKAFWLVKRDRERYCFRCDSVITQRLTQWNCSVPPKGFGPRENEHWMHLSHSLCPISFYFPVSLTHTHTSRTYLGTTKQTVEIMAKRGACTKHLSVWRNVFSGW